MKDMVIKKFKLDELNPAKYNPRKKLKPGDREFKKLEDSIKNFGYVELIVVNTSGQRVAFHVNDVQRIIPYEEQRLKSMDETNEYALGVYELDSSEQLIIVNTQTDIFLKGEKTYDSDYRL